LPGQADTFKPKQLARLGELPLHQMALPINSLAGEGFKGWKIEGKKRKNTEKRKRRRKKIKVEALLNRTVDYFLHHLSC